MNDELLDDRSRRAAESARTWASNDADVRSGDALAAVREAAGRPPVVAGSNRRTPLLLGAAALVVGAVAGAAVLVDRDAVDDVLVPVDTAGPKPTSPEPTSPDLTIADTVPDTQVTPTSAQPTEPVPVDPNAAPAPRTFGVDVTAPVQDTFPVAEAVLGVGPGDMELGSDGVRGPFVPSFVDELKFVVADPVNGRARLVDWYALELGREPTREEAEGFVPDFPAVIPLPVFPDTGTEPADIQVGQPVVGPSGDEIFVPARPGPPDGDEIVVVQRYVRNEVFAWEYADAIPFGVVAVDDEFVIEGRALVHVPTGDVAHDLGPDAPFTPIVRERPDGWAVTDEAGVETVWDIGSFDGDATGLADGSVVFAGVPDDSPAADADAVLLRLWPDGTSARSRYALGRAAGFRRVTADGAATISMNVNGEWLLQQWPLPGRAQEPPTQPDEDVGDCEALYGGGTRDRFFTEPANGYVLPWTVAGGPAGDNGAYVVVYDALGRVVLGGGCSSNSTTPDQLEVRGADYTTYGDSVIVAVAEPLSLGGVDDAPAWLGEPIAEGVIDSLASEVKVYRVPDDRELPDADEDNTFLLVQVRGARLIRISSGGIGVHVPQDDVLPLDDPFDLRGQATDFAQGYLEALADGRWQDAATYIDDDSRNWEDRPAFADLFALVGEDVGTAEALERWCTEERDCTRGVVNGVLQQTTETQVEMAITFEVPGGGMFDPIINPLWTVGWLEGGLVLDGLPQVPR